MKKKKKVSDFSVRINSPVVRLDELVALTSFSRTTIWRRCKSDPNFPKPFPLGKVTKGWNREIVLKYLSARYSRAA